MIDFEEFKERYQKVPVEEYPNRVVETMPKPVVSVQVSTYQHADFIHDCMEGVLMQETDFPFEILIGEDESDDGTREICEEYAEQYPEQIRLFLHRRENNIAIHGRPTGRFQSTYSKFMARGKYIAICEGDDYWTDPKKLQKQVDFLEAHPKYSYAYHAWVSKDEGKELQDTKELIRKARKKEKVNTRPHTAALMFKNIFDDWPEEIVDVFHGDTFLRRRLELHGDGGFVSGVTPNVRRIHAGGVRESLSPFIKHLRVFQSNAKMMDFFLNTPKEEERKKYAVEYLCKMIECIDDNINTMEKYKKMYECMKTIKKYGVTWKLTKKAVPSFRRLARYKLSRAAKYIYRKCQ